ncbi:MAG TPA: carboxypeptidase-like regulatory domain-containing protein [Candidatus Acidoferrales bacterium]|nr:carboxypeptidase-like regulatory domain-containing protein [Candidatus Acidoferrales bacterium]
MKSLASALVCLLFAIPAICASPYVWVAVFQPSTQNAVITVRLEGKPQKGMKVLVSSFDRRRQLTLVTDSRGMIHLPNLPAGKYSFIASLSPTLWADLYLRISARHSPKPSTFDMFLTPKLPPPPTLEEQLEAARKEPVTLHTQILTGVVKEPGGSGLPSARIAIYKHDLGEKAPPLSFTADEHGRFSVPLEPGTYTAAFYEAGFAIKFLNFEIAPQAGQQSVEVKLNLAPST